MNNLKRIRIDKNLSQSQLAKLAEISVRTLQDYEQGHKNINKAQALTLYKLSKALNCNMEELLELTGE